MRKSLHQHGHVCLSCLLRIDQSIISKGQQSWRIDFRSGAGQTTQANLSCRVQERRNLHSSTASRPFKQSLSSSKRETSPNNITGHESPAQTVITQPSDFVQSPNLTVAQRGEIGRLLKFAKKLEAIHLKTKRAKEEPESAYLARLLQIASERADVQETRIIRNLSRQFKTRTYNKLQDDISLIAPLRDPHANGDEPVPPNVLARLDILDRGQHARKVQSVGSNPATRAKLRRVWTAPRSRGSFRTTAAIVDEINVAKARGILSPKIRKKILQRGVLTPAPEDAAVVDVQQIIPKAIEPDHVVHVPQLSHGLGRVLFNPGVYQLQDQRSRVYNFDPSLSKIIPLKEFNFDLLNPYITSSNDRSLSSLAKEHGKRYVGSTSSMTGAMSQFHFILSAWRLPNLQNMAQERDSPKNFTVITRAPASIFLRWKDGVYAVDADKEHDTPNVLMMQGKSMEKLLTLDKDEFEKYHQSNSDRAAAELVQKPEAYHYTAVEDFLLRSQLDAYDSRLPGTGMFDLKTRAVAGIRMRIEHFEDGMGYEIKGRYGPWESYEKEYADMIRAAFLKYSLQARMGRMDGIFVCFHNIARIFGFQYIPLSEMDLALHGTDDTTLGDQEFNATLRLMNDIFDLATKEFPEQSVRILFETRDQSIQDPNGVLKIFVLPSSEEQIRKLQSVKQSVQTDFEDKVMRGLSPSRGASKSAEVDSSETDDSESTPILAWDLRVYNEVNGQMVVRPEKLSSNDNWVVKYKLERLGDSMAREQYKLSKRRQTKALAWTEKDDDNGFFANKIRLLNERGRDWRRVQDEIDAGREPVWYRDDAAGSGS